MRKQTSKESSLVFAILCNATDEVGQSGILLGLPKDQPSSDTERRLQEADAGMVMPVTAVKDI